MPRAMRPAATFGRLFALLAVNRGALAGAAALQLGQALTYMPFAAGVTWFVDHVLGRARALGHKQVLLWMAVYVAGNVALWFVHAAFTLAAFASSQRLSRSATARLRCQVVEQLQRLSLTFFARKGPGALSNQLTVDSNRVESFFSFVTGNLFSNVVLGVATTLYLLWLNPLLAATATGVLSLQFATLSALQARVNRAHAHLQVQGEDFASAMSEFLMSIKPARSLGYDSAAAASLTTRIHSMREAGLGASIASTRMALRLQMVQQLAPPVLWCVGGWLFVTGRSTLGELVGFMALTGFVQSGMQAFTNGFEQWLAARPGFEALLHLLDAQEVEDFVDAKTDKRPRGEVVFDDVTFEVTVEGKPRALLQNVSFTIAPGETVGIVGPSGAGKSTLLDLLVAFHRPTSGRILYDGVDVAELGRKTIRQCTALLGQEPFLWNASLGDNIRVGRPDASMSEIEAAARRAGLSALLDGRPEGLDAPVGERGTLLSGGERQRVALARLFLRDPVFVVLDEPTSALDNQTEATLVPEITALCRGRTAFIVAHRLHTLAQVDRVLRLEGGRLVDGGQARPGPLEGGGHSSH